MKTVLNELKKELIAPSNATGINSFEPLNCSEKLDQLIIIYQLHVKDNGEK